MTSAVSDAITIDRNGQHLYVTDDDIRRLGDLTTPHIVARPDDRHGYDVARERHSLLRAPDGAVFPNAGLAPILMQRAAMRGVRLEIHSTFPIGPLPEPSHVQQLAYPQVARFVRRNERGLIRRPQGIPPEEIIGDLAVAYPDSRIIVLGNNIPQLRKICRALAPRVDDVRCVSAREPLVLGEDEEPPRVICSTFYGGASDTDFSSCDIVILVDAYQCTHERAQMALAQVDARFRLFGIADFSRRVSPTEWDTVMAVFGPEVVDLYGPRLTRRQVNVAWGDHHSRSVSLSPSDPDYLRQCYWHDERRNRKIRQLATALADGRVPDRPEYGQVSQWLAGREHRPQTVVVLVERPLHAVALARMLPLAEIIAQRDQLHGWPSSLRRRIRDRPGRWQPAEIQIVLADAAYQFPGTLADVVIWASGGPHAAPLLGFWLAEADGHEKPLLVVDLVDHHNQTAQDWSRCREDAYHDREIYPVGLTATQGRIAMFLWKQQQEEANEH